MYPALAIDQHDATLPFQPLSSLNFVFTTKCNLRCTYCASIAADYQGQDTPDNLLRYLIDYIKWAGIPRVNMGFFGETTFRKGWHHYALELIEAGVELSLVSNFNLPLSDSEVFVLSRFQQLDMSVDCLSKDLLKEIRPPANIGRMLYNMHRVRSRALSDRVREPRFHWYCVITNKNAHQLADYLAFVISNRVKHVGLNEIQKYEGARPEVFSWFELEGQEYLDAYAQLEAAERLAATHGVQIHYPSLAWRQFAAYKNHAERARLAGESPAPPYPFRPPQLRLRSLPGWGRIYLPDLLEGLPAGHTRLCSSPWDTVYVGPDGNVYPCCVSPEPLGRITSSTTLDDILQADSYRLFRENLLRGDIQGQVCFKCPIRPLAPNQKEHDLITQGPCPTQSCCG